MTLKSILRLQVQSQNQVLLFDENINALIGLVSLFALSIIRLITPNLSAWREASEKTIDAQKLRLQELQQRAS